MKQKLIMIADDDVDLVNALGVRFRNLGCDVIQATDGYGASFELFLSDPNAKLPDLVILDVEMPECDGLTICEDMISDGLLQSIPVIILTGRTDVQTIQWAENLGAHYVHKSPRCWQHLEALSKELMESGGRQVLH